MISLRINCFDSQEQAEEFVHWLSNEGEQVFNDSKNTDTKPIKIDHKISFDHKKVLWSGNTTVLVLQEKLSKEDKLIPLPEAKPEPPKKVITRKIVGK